MHCGYWTSLGNGGPRWLFMNNSDEGNFQAQMTANIAAVGQFDPFTARYNTTKPGCACASICIMCV